MQNHKDLISYYEKKLKKYSHGPLAVDWNCSEAQEMLFFALLDGLDEDHLRSGKVKILDVGCGLGALYGFLKKQGYQVDYTGIDIAPGMVAGGRKSYPEATFEVRDILQQPFEENSFDYVFLSGSISIKLANHERYARRMIARMFSFARVALCFNVLSGRALASSRNFQLDDLRYYPQPLAIADFCHGLTPLINMRHEAASWTVTMQLFKQQDVTARVINRYVTYLEAAGTSEADCAIANTLMELGAISRTLARAPVKDSADYLNFKAVCLARLGDGEAEITALKKALALEPDHLWAQLNLGTIYHRLGDYDTAELAYRRVLAAHPDNSVARSQLFYILLRKVDKKAALEVADKFEEKAERLFFRGEYYYLTGDFAAAYKAYQQAAGLAVYLAEAQRKMALCAQSLQNEKLAFKHWQKVYAQLPYDSQSLRWLANYYFEHGQNKKVVALLENVVFDATLVDLLGRAYYALGRKKLAREIWQENLTDSGKRSPFLDQAGTDIEETH